MADAYVHGDLEVLAAIPLRAGQAIADTGCSAAVAGSNWIRQYEEALQARGLSARRFEHQMSFQGLGGSRRQSFYSWKLPVGIHGVATEMTVAEIQGDMMCLLSRPTMQAWGAQIEVADRKWNLTELEIEKASFDGEGDEHLLVDLLQFPEKLNDDYRKEFGWRCKRRTMTT